MTDFSLVDYLAHATGFSWLPAALGALMLVALVTVLMRNVAPPDFVMLTAAVACGLIGLVKPSTVFEGFSDTSMLTVAALYVVAAALMETGAPERLGRVMFGGATTERQVMWRMYVTVTGLSAFLNNTPIVA